MQLRMAYFSLEKCNIVQLRFKEEIQLAFSVVQILGPARDEDWQAWVQCGPIIMQMKEWVL